MDSLEGKGLLKHGIIGASGRSVPTFPAYVDTTYAGTTTGGPITVARPDITGANFLIAFCASSYVYSDFTPPSGWTRIAALKSDCGNDVTIDVFYRVIASEPANYTFSFPGSTSDVVAAISSFSGVDTADPFDGYENGGECPGRTYDLFPALTISANNRTVISYIATEVERTDMVTPPTFDAQFTDIFLTSLGVSALQWGAAYADNVSAGSVNPKWTVPIPGQDGFSAAIALKGAT